jgi:predicted nucleic acid-binding protein
VTKNHIMAERNAIIRPRMGIPQAVNFANTVRSGSEIELFWVEPVHHSEAVELTTPHAGKRWSVTDRSSFAIMRSLWIVDAFTFDRDFVQADFTARP